MKLRGALLLALACALPARAQAKDAIDPAKLKSAIDRGVKWLQGLQKPDGSFGLPPVKTSTLERGFPMGYSALATLTLLKCGTPPNDPSIVRAFRHLYTLPLRRTYSVALLVLCIEARYAPPAKLKKKKGNYTSAARRFFRAKANKADRRKLQECVSYLVSKRSKGFKGAGWRYPSSEAPDQDNSCTQYAMLALKGARRMGAKVPLEVFEKVADFFVAQQDATGPEVAWFPIPAADGPIHEMLSLEERKKRKAKLEKKRARTRSRKGDESLERRAMYARGWSYLPRKVEGPRTRNRKGPVPKRSDMTRVSSGSMTCSGIAALCIAKSELELSSASWRRRAGPVNDAIRDGVAWMAHYFSPRGNPSAGKKKGSFVGWKYYYLYSVERAGVLAGTYKFGPHDWWEEGAAHLLTQQRPEGTWPDTKGISRLGRTCFALLFLKRATVPLVPFPPKRIMTGR